MKRKSIKALRYTAIGLSAAIVGMIIANAVVVDAEADDFIRKTDAFIEEHETKAEIKMREFDDEMEKTAKKTQSATISAQNLTIEDDSLDPDFFAMINGNEMTPEQFREAGVIYWGMWKFTWYSEQVLPGDGLEIPGRWSDGDFVRDEDGYLCVASNEIPQGEIVDTPFGEAKVYDWIGDGVTGVCDIYVSW